MLAWWYAELLNGFVLVGFTHILALRFIEENTLAYRSFSLERRSTFLYYITICKVCRSHILGFLKFFDVRIELIT